MFSNYQLKIAYFYDISIGTVKELVPNFFNKNVCVLHYENLQLHLRLRLKLKNRSCIRIQSIGVEKTICVQKPQKKE